MVNLHQVFVYGTLKNGEPNHACFAEKGYYRFIDNAKTVEKYPLIIGTKYNIPFLLYSPGKGHQIHGELYEVDDIALTRLDELEDHPNFYIRNKYDIEFTNGNRTQAWIYFIMDFKESVLAGKTFYEIYSNNGSHGLKYVERYLREKTTDWRKHLE